MHGVPSGKVGDDPADAKKDKGKLVLPKRFRRLVEFSEDSKSIATLTDFLRRSKSETW